MIKKLFQKKAKAKHLVKAANIVSDILIELEALTRPGVNLGMLDELAARRIIECGATSFNKNYHPRWSKKPYPATICASVDEEVAHAPPGLRELEEGQIVNYDIGIKYKTACGDAALSVPVGDISNKKERLLRYAKRALYAGIEEIKAGVPVSKIGETIAKSANLNGYNIIKDFGGHGIGIEMHEAPLIPNFYDERNDDKILVEGQVICIEPMITTGNAKIGILGTDGWTAFTLDGQVCAMFEEMVLVKKNSYEILTSHLTQKN